MFLGLEFTDQEWKQIKTHCQRFNLELIVTCHVESAVERIEKLDLKVNKICTWSLSHYRMIANLAKNRKPLILDTGTINTLELEVLESFYQEHGGGKLYVLYDFHTNIYLPICKYLKNSALGDKTNCVFSLLREDL